MLNFDESHNHIKQKINHDGWLGFKIIIGGTIIVVLGTSGIVASSWYEPCDIEEEHAHLYIDPDTKIERYIDSELKDYEGLTRLDDYKVITPNEARELEFLNKYDLFKIEDNKEELLSKEKENQQNPVEYRYKYTETIHWSTPIKIGKTWSVQQHSKEVTRYSWTTDQSKNLTGETRNVEYKYYGYKVSQDEYKRYKLEESDLYDSIEEIPPEYQYVGRAFYTTVDPLTHEELDYGASSVDDEFSMSDDIPNNDSVKEVQLQKEKALDEIFQTSEEFSQEVEEVKRID